MTKGIFGIIGSLLAGVAVGGGVMYILEERKYKKILNANGEDNDEAEATRQKFIEERAKKALDEVKKITDVPFEVNENKENDVEYNLAEIKEKLRNGKAKVTDYTNMYSASDLVDAKNDEEDDTTDDEENVEEEDEIQEQEKTAANIFESLKKSTRAPRIVKEEQVDEAHEGWDVSSLFLYSNGVVTDEEDNVIDGEELDKMVGECLTKYDFINSKEKTIYIKCYAMETFYEITKFDKPFDD